jgi:hypothetical protein
VRAGHAAIRAGADDFQNFVAADLHGSLPVERALGLQIIAKDFSRYARMHVHYTTQARVLKEYVGTTKTRERLAISHMCHASDFY